MSLTSVSDGWNDTIADIHVQDSVSEDKKLKPRGILCLAILVDLMKVVFMNMCPDIYIYKISILPSSPVSVVTDSVCRCKLFLLEQILESSFVVTKDEIILISLYLIRSERVMDDDISPRKLGVYVHFDA